MEISAGSQSLYLVEYTCDRTVSGKIIMAELLVRAKGILETLSEIVVFSFQFIVTALLFSVAAEASQH